MKLIFQRNRMGVGKKKQAVARVFLALGNGKLIINKIAGEKYLQYNETYLNTIWTPLERTNLETNFNIIAFVNGGGLAGQSEAIKLGVSRLLYKMDSKHYPVLKSFGLLTRDSRIKERKKFGLRKARKAPQYSKR